MLNILKATITSKLIDPTEQSTEVECFMGSGSTKRSRINIYFLAEAYACLGP